MFQRIRNAFRRPGGHRRLVALPAAVVAACGVAAIVVAATNQVTPPEPPPTATGTILGSPDTVPAPADPATRAPHTTAAMPTPDQSQRTAGGQTLHPHPSPTQSAPTEPPAETETTPTRSAGSSSATPAAGEKPPPHLSASKPVFIDISTIDVHSKVFAIGKASDGGLQVPQPGPHFNDVAWYKNSPTPGQLGPSVLEGHIDTVQGPSVFLYLGALKPGDTVSITRADDRVAVFTVNAVRSYPTHQAFPTQLVYGARGDLDRATLRLITCSNFNHSTGHYEGNTIVFAHLTGVHPQ